MLGRAARVGDDDVRSCHLQGGSAQDGHPHFFHHDRLSAPCGTPQTMSCYLTAPVICGLVQECLVVTADSHSRELSLYAQSSKNCSASVCLAASCLSDRVPAEQESCCTPTTPAENYAAKVSKSHPLLTQAGFLIARLTQDTARRQTMSRGSDTHCGTGHLLPLVPGCTRVNRGCATLGTVCTRISELRCSSFSICSTLPSSPQKVCAHRGLVANGTPHTRPVQRSEPVLRTFAQYSRHHA